MSAPGDAPAITRSTCTLDVVTIRPSSHALDRSSWVTRTIASDVVASSFTESAIDVDAPASVGVKTASAPIVETSEAVKRPRRYVRIMVHAVYAGHVTPPSHNRPPVVVIALAAAIVASLFTRE